MSVEQQVMQQSTLLNRLVIDRRTAEEVGRVEQLWLLPQSHLVVGFSCKSGFLGQQKRAFSWAQVDSIGADSIMVNSTPDGVDPPKPEGVIGATGHEVWTDTGNKAGKLVDYLFVPHTGTVINYLFSSNGWRGVLDGIYILHPAAVVSAGTKKIIVSEAAVLHPEKYAEGLAEKMSQAAEFAQKDYEKTVDHWENLKRRTQVGTEGLKRGAQQLAEELHDKAEVVKERAVEKVAEVRTKMKKEESVPVSGGTIEVTPVESQKEEESV